jgi:hypothetical protein
MPLRERIEKAFAHRPRPVEVVKVTSPYEIDSDVKQALWFRDHDWHDITWQDWQQRRVAILFLSNEAFAYFLPSVLLLSLQNPNEALGAAESLIWELDRSPSKEGWSNGFESRFLQLRSEEFDVLKQWLLELCEFPPYKGWDLASSGPGEIFGRAFDTLDLLQKEAERRHLTWLGR